MNVLVEFHPLFVGGLGLCTHPKFGSVVRIEDLVKILLSWRLPYMPLKVPQNWIF